MSVWAPAIKSSSSWTLYVFLFANICREKKKIELKKVKNFREREGEKERES
jgi:hypothetical protein